MGFTKLQCIGTEGRWAENERAAAETRSRAGYVGKVDCGAITAVPGAIPLRYGTSDPPGQPGKSVAAPKVNWFYVVASFFESPMEGEVRE